MNINCLKLSLPFTFFKNQFFKHSNLSERINAAVLPVFVILISLSLGLAIYKFLRPKTNAEVSNKSPDARENDSTATISAASQAFQEFCKSPDATENDFTATISAASQASQEFYKSPDATENDPTAIISAASQASQEFYRSPDATENDFTATISAASQASQEFYKSPDATENDPTATISAASQASQEFYKSPDATENDPTATISAASQEFYKSLEEWKNDPTATGDKERACKRISEVFDKKLHDLDLSCLNLSSIPEAIDKLTQLTDLNLKNNQLKSLPEAIGSLTQLVWLYLDHNQLQSLPESIGSLTQIRDLNLSHNQLKSLPEATGSLTQLVWLYLDHNQLQSLPESIGNFIQLQWLSLNNNQLQSLPEAIGNLTRLEWLYLDHNQLQSLPEAINKLIQLGELNLSNNQLQFLPEAIGSLTQLESLSLNNNQLKSLPEAIGSLTQLQWLYLNHNQLQSLPETICSLNQLQWLNLSNNQLQSLPEAINKLIQLGELNLSHNQLRFLPATISSLIQLERLYLNSNQLQALPQSINNLAILAILDVSDNRDLAELPVSLGELVNLSFIGYFDTLILRQAVGRILDLCRAKRNRRDDLIPRLKAWASINNSQVLIEETKVEALEINEKQTLNEWLRRLALTKDYQKNQKPLAALVCQLIQTVLDKEEFKAVFMGQAETNNEACQDRSAMNLNVIYLYWKLNFLPPESSLKDKLQLLIKASKTLALRKNLEALVYAQELENGHKEEESVEIYLYYEMTLQEELNLLTAIQEMTYSPIGERDWIDLEELKASVQKDYLIELAKLDAFDQLAKTDPFYCQEWQLLENGYEDLVLEHPTSEVSTQREKAKIELIQKWFKSLSL